MAERFKAIDCKSIEHLFFIGSNPIVFKTKNIFIFGSSVVERMAVNHLVVGSTPTQRELIKFKIKKANGGCLEHKNGR